MQKWILVLLAGSLWTQDARAELTAEQIVEKANMASYYAGQDGRATVTMTLTDKDGRTRTREFVMLRLTVKEGGDQKFYVYFKEPADVRQMAYLVWKNTGTGRDDDRWLWLPALNLVRRIAPGDKRTSFVGSDFLYEDVSGRGTREDVHELAETTDTVYRLKSTPRSPGEVEFSYYDVWIDRTTFLPKKAEYYDKNGKLYRRVEAVEVREVQGFPTVIQSRASDLVNGSSTLNVFTGVEYNMGLTEQIFNERFLRRPPREIR